MSTGRERPQRGIVVELASQGEGAGRESSPDGDDPLDGWDEEKRRWTFWRHWNVQAGYALLLQARGLGAAEVAARLPCPLWQVQRILAPCLPDRCEELRERSPGMRALYETYREALLAYASSKAAWHARSAAERMGWEAEALRFADLEARSEQAFERLLEGGALPGLDAYGAFHAAGEDVRTGIGYHDRAGVALHHLLDVEPLGNRERFIEEVARIDREAAGRGGGHGRDRWLRLLRTFLRREEEQAEQEAGEAA